MHSNVSGYTEQSVIERFPLFRGYFICTAMNLDPQKQSVIERFQVLEEFVTRGPLYNEV